MPTTRCGVETAEAISVTESAEVFVASTVSAGQMPSSSAQSLLRRELLDDRLDHEVAVGEVGEVGRQREPPDRDIPGGLLELALLDLAREEVRDPVARALAQLGRHLAADRLDAGLDAELRDPRAHCAEPDDADLADLPRHRRGPYPSSRGPSQAISPPPTPMSERAAVSPIPRERKPIAGPLRTPPA